MNEDQKTDIEVGKVLDIMAGRVAVLTKENAILAAQLQTIQEEMKGLRQESEELRKAIDTK